MEKSSSKSRRYGLNFGYSIKNKYFNIKTFLNFSTPFLKKILKFNCTQVHQNFPNQPCYVL
jgi:hypothetical protein